MHQRDKCSACEGAGRVVENRDREVVGLYDFVAGTRRIIERLNGAILRSTELGAKARSEGNHHCARLCDEELAAFDRLALQQHAIANNARACAATCLACRGTGLDNIACEGCGEPVDSNHLNDDALEVADILVHPTCDTNAPYFDEHPAEHTPRGENFWGSREAQGWR